MRLCLPTFPGGGGTQCADRSRRHAGDQVACRLEKTLILSTRASQRATPAKIGELPPPGDPQLAYPWLTFAATDAPPRDRILQDYIHLRIANTCDQTQNARISLGDSRHRPTCEDVVKLGLKLGLRITEAPIGPVLGFPEPSGSPASTS